MMMTQSKLDIIKCDLTQYLEGLVNDIASRENSINILSNEISSLRSEKMEIGRILEAISPPQISYQIDKSELENEVKVDTQILQNAYMKVLKTKFPIVKDINSHLYEPHRKRSDILCALHLNGGCNFLTTSGVSKNFDEINTSSYLYHLHILYRVKLIDRNKYEKGKYRGWEWKIKDYIYNQVCSDMKKDKESKNDKVIS
jgi:hypothetical protein